MRSIRPAPPPHLYCHIRLLCAMQFDLWGKYYFSWKFFKLNIAFPAYRYRPFRLCLVYWDFLWSIWPCLPRLLDLECMENLKYQEEINCGSKGKEKIITNTGDGQMKWIGVASGSGKWRKGWVGHKTGAQSTRQPVWIDLIVSYELV